MPRGSEPYRLDETGKGEFSRALEVEVFFVLFTPPLGPTVLVRSWRTVDISMVEAEMGATSTTAGGCALDEVEAAAGRGERARRRPEQRRGYGARLEYRWGRGWDEDVKLQGLVLKEGAEGGRFFARRQGRVGGWHSFEQLDPRGNLAIEVGSGRAERQEVGSRSASGNAVRSSPKSSMNIIETSSMDGRSVWMSMEDAAIPQITQMVQDEHVDINDPQRRGRFTAFEIHPKNTAHFVAIFETPIGDLGSWITAHSVGSVPLCPASVYMELVFAGVDMSGQYLQMEHQWSTMTATSCCAASSSRGRWCMMSGFTISSRAALTGEESVHVRGEFKYQSTHHTTTKFVHTLPVISYARNVFVVHPVWMDTLPHVASFVADLQGGGDDAYICTQVGAVKVFPALVNNDKPYAVYCNNTWLEEGVVLEEAYAVQVAEPWRIVARTPVSKSTGPESGWSVNRSPPYPPPPAACCVYKIGLPPPPPPPAPPIPPNIRSPDSEGCELESDGCPEEEADKDGSYPEGSVDAESEDGCPRPTGAVWR
ncbi:hypothetical protein B0H14DRAFT_3483168 [Mycena olivaceomarginata]|nr:hypothetical protein B0H14DRAFT_3483168 [Mycena olivaceomarginata]